MQGTEPVEPRNRDVIVHVTDADVHAARDAWARAQSAAPGSARAATLYESYRLIVRTQAQQIAEEFRAARAS